MATWLGAIVVGADPRRLVAAASACNVELEPGFRGDRLVIEIKPKLRDLGPPAIAERLSREAGCTVIAFAAQTSADVYQVLHFEGGALVRELAYLGDDGGWVTQSGVRQPWEDAFDAACHPDEEDGNDDDGDDDGDDQLDARPRPSSTLPLVALCNFYGLDGFAPQARWNR